jgi:hypothetical protein
VDEHLEFLLWCGERLEHRIAGRRLTLRDLLIAMLLRIRARDGRGIPLRLNPAQREFSRRPACGQHIILKARQLGFTTYIAARFFIATITRPGTLSVLVAHDQDAAQEIFQIVRRFVENLPRCIRGNLETSRSNVRQVVFPALDSQFRVESAADENCGRGLTIQNLHCSEVARWPGDAAATLASLRASFAGGKNDAMVLESTPHGAAGCFYDEWQRAPETGTQPHFFPWWWEPAYRREHVSGRALSDEESELRKAHSLSWEQIAFRREMRSSFRSLASQEFAEDPSSCFLASGDCVFDLETIAARLNAISDATDSRDNGRLQIWFPPLRGREYIVGCDPAGGGANGDYACAQVIDRASGMQCAQLRGHWPPREFAARITMLGREYNDALLVVERNNHGHGVLAYLGGGRYENVYCHKEQPGWPTTVSSRPRMIESFAALLAESPEHINSRALLEECRTFIRRDDGSAAAANGAHDDCIIAMAIALAVRNEVAASFSHRGNWRAASLPN